MPAMPPPRWGLLGGTAGIVLLAVMAAHAQTLGPTRTEELTEALGVESRVQPQKETGKPTSVDLEGRYQDLLVQAQTAQRAARAAGDEVLKLADELDGKRAVWNDRVQALRENEDGRRLAADPEKVKLFRAATKTAEVPTSEEVEKIRVRTKADLRPTDDALRDPTSRYLPPKELVDTLARERAMLERHLANLQDGENAVAGLLRQVAGATPSAQTLQAVLDTLAQDDALARVAEQARLEDQQKQEARAQELARAERAAEEKRRDEELRAEQEGAQSARARDILKKANDPEFARAFSPFLASASTRVGGSPYTVGEHPAAFSDIENKGGFRSQKALKFLIQHPDGGKGRRKGKRDGWEAAVERFNDFESVARVWVAQCKLLNSPTDAGRPCTPESGEQAAAAQ